MNAKGYWLGFFFMLVLIVLGFGTLAVGNLSMLATTYPYTVHFDKVEGLKDGADVRVDGVVMGKVDALRLVPGGVEADIRLERPLELRKDWEIYVESFSILGGNYISITRGKSEETVETGTMLSGRVRPNAMEQIGEAVQENREDLRRVMDNLARTLEGTKSIVDRVNTGDGTLSRIINDPALYNDARGAVEELKTAASDVRQITEKINRGDGTVAKLLNTDELHRQLVDGIGELREETKKTLDQVRTVADSAKEAIERVSKGEGLTGRAINDKKVADDFAATVEKIKNVADNLEQISGQIRSGKGSIGKLIQEDTLADKAEGALDSVDAFIGRASRALVYLGADTSSFFDTEVGRSRLYVRIEPDNTKYFLIGGSFLSLSADGDTVVFDKQLEEGEDDTEIKVDLQAMYKIPWFFDNHVGIRAGLFEGKPGGAIDIDFTLFDHEFRLSAEARDDYGHVDDEDIDENIRGVMTRVSLMTPLWKAPPTAKDAPKPEWYEQILYALKAHVGVARLQDDPEIFAGIGFEYSDQDIRTLLGLVTTAR